jgi:hypothetical protein
MPNFLTQRIFWLNLIGFLIQLAQYLLGQHYWPGADVPLAIVLAALQILANMIGGGTAMAKLKKALALKSNTKSG